MASPTPEFIATLAIGVALTGLILRQGARLDGRIDRLEGRIDRMNERVEEHLGRLEQRQADLRERMAKLEGLLEGLREAITGKSAT